MALSNTLSHLATGLGDGTVLLFRHLYQSIFSSSTSLTSLSKPRTTHESPTEPITTLGFGEPVISSAHEVQTNGHAPAQRQHQEKPKNDLYDYIPSAVLSGGQATGRVSGANPSIVDEVGAGLRCAAMDWHKRDIVVAREEAIYVCAVEGRGSCYACEGVYSYLRFSLYFDAK